jgi:hypothetical protein
MLRPRHARPHTTSVRAELVEALAYPSRSSGRTDMNTSRSAITPCAAPRHIILAITKHYEFNSCLRNIYVGYWLKRLQKSLKTGRKRVKTALNQTPTKPQISRQSVGSASASQSGLRALAVVTLWDQKPRLSEPAGRVCAASPQSDNRRSFPRSGPQTGSQGHCPRSGAG